MNIPQECRYAETHEWVRLEGDIATVGVSDYAQGELGDVVFLDFSAQPGAQLDRKQAFGTVEAVKTVSDLYAPVAGEVIETNASLADAPEQVNTDPYGAGWMIRFRVADPATALDGLMTADEYQAHAAH